MRYSRVRLCVVRVLWLCAPWIARRPSSVVNGQVRDMMQWTVRVTVCPVHRSILIYFAFI